MMSYRPAALSMTGATGALGFAFLQRVFDEIPELKVRLLVRKASASFRSETFQAWHARHESAVTLVEGDVRELSASQLDSLLQTDGGLWHFAALTALKTTSVEVSRQINEVNVEGTQRLLDGFTNCPGSGPFYHISTAYVVGDRTGVAQETEDQKGQSSRNPYKPRNWQRNSGCSTASRPEQRARFFARAWWWTIGPGRAASRWLTPAPTRWRWR